MRARLTGWRPPTWRSLGFFVVLPNLAFAALSPFVYLQHPIVNVDYLAVWTVSRSLPGIVTGGLYALCLLLDAVVSAEGIYDFSTADVLLNVQFLPQLDPARVWSVAILLACFVMLAASIIARGGLRDDGAARAPASRYARSLGVIAVLALAAGAAMSSAEFWEHPFDAQEDVRFAASRALEVVESSVALRVASLQGRSLFTPAKSRGSLLMADLAAAPTRTPPYDIVLILVESEGLLRNGRDEAQVLAPLTGRDIAARYAVTTGAQPFTGATLSAELRELCGLRGSGVDAENVRSLPPCLPRQLGRRGFHTLSFHGNTGSFFDRERWYPLLGFDRSYFTEQMQAASHKPMASCGAMVQGLCDLEVAERVQGELRHRPPIRKFLYWLTLSSHLPVDLALAQDSAFDCAATASLEQGSQPCALERILYNLHHRIAAMVLDPAIARTRFIIVGDHAPPFPDRAGRELYDTTRVPFIDLVPL